MCGDRYLFLVDVRAHINSIFLDDELANRSFVNLIADKDVSWEGALDVDLGADYKQNRRFH